jgi:hypothetical protein
MEKVTEEIAKQEFERWFNSKKLSASYRKESYEAIEVQMVDAIVDGFIIVNEDNTLTLKLAWPLSNPNEVNELKFVHRMTTGELQSKTAYVKDLKDQQGKMIATIAALTGQVGGIIRALDSSDYSRAGCIASYFF